MFSLPLEVEGRPDLASSLGVFMAFPKTLDPLENGFFPLGHTLHKPLAKFDEFQGHSCPVSQETRC